MKTKSAILAFAFVLSTAFASLAQTKGEPAIKVLPTNQSGVIKVLFAYDSDKPVTVKFYSDGKLVGTDKIKGKSFSKGFSKRYDVSHISDSNFRVEVESENVTVTYQILESQGTLSYDAQLLQTTFNYPLTASNRID